MVYSLKHRLNQGSLKQIRHGSSEPLAVTMSCHSLRLFNWGEYAPKYKNAFWSSRSHGRDPYDGLWVSPSFFWTQERHGLEKWSLGLPHIESITTTQHDINHSNGLACCQELRTVNTTIMEDNMPCCVNVSTEAAFVTWFSTSCPTLGFNLRGIVTVYQTILQ